MLGQRLADAGFQDAETGARSQPFQVIAVVDAHDPTMASQAVELAVTLP